MADMASAAARLVASSHDVGETNHIQRSSNKNSQNIVAGYRILWFTRTKLQGLDEDGGDRCSAGTEEGGVVKAMSAQVAQVVAPAS